MGLTRFDNIGETATVVTIGAYIANRKPGRRCHMTVLHNSATPQAQDKGLETVIGFHRYHQSRTWRCIGYHFVISVDGTIYAGRKMEELGAHAGADGNPGSIGVCLVGNFDKDDRPTLAQVGAFRALHFELWRQLYGKAPDAWRVRFHREYMATSCPGKHVTNATVAQWLIGADEPAPIPVPVPAPADPEPPDVAPWAAEAVEYCLERGLLTLDADGRFGGDDPVTRNMLAVAAARLHRDR